MDKLLYSIIKHLIQGNNISEVYKDIKVVRDPATAKFVLKVEYTETEIQKWFVQGVARHHPLNRLLQRREERRELYEYKRTYGTFK